MKSWRIWINCDTNGDCCLYCCPEVSCGCLVLHFTQTFSVSFHRFSLMPRVGEIHMKVSSVLHDSRFIRFLTADEDNSTVFSLSIKMILFISTAPMGGSPLAATTAPWWPGWVTAGDHAPNTTNRKNMSITLCGGCVQCTGIWHNNHLHYYSRHNP